MIEDDIKIEDLANNQEIKDAAMNAIVEAFPEEISTIALDDNFNKQLETAPMAVLVYASAIKAYANNNNRTDPLKEFPDLISLYNEDSERGLYFHAQIVSANQEYSQDSNIGGGKGIERLNANINDGYQKGATSPHISFIANYGLQWQPKSEKKYEDYITKQQALPQINFDERLTNMAAETIGEIWGRNIDQFDELIQNPSLTIAIAEYTIAFRHQKHSEKLPFFEEMKNNQEIKQLAEQIAIIGKSAETYDSLPMVLDTVRTNPQDFFTKEGFINTEEFDKQQKMTSEKNIPIIPRTLGDYTK